MINLNECEWMTKRFHARVAERRRAPGGRDRNDVWVHHALRILSPHNSLPVVRYHLRNKVILNRAV